MKAGMLGIGALLACLASGAAIVACSHPASKIATTWDPKAAATYLDYREGWWAEWTGSTRDHGTFCVSCHTALPLKHALRPDLPFGWHSPNQVRQSMSVV